MAEKTDLTGQTIGGRYKVAKLLGEGAMGAVYLADDTELERHVALKVLHQEWVAQPDIRRRLDNECRILAKLGGHPHIVNIFDRLNHGEDVVIVMEFVPGETLEDVLQRTLQFNQSTDGKRATVPLTGGGLMLDQRQAVKFAIDCLDALHFAHSQGVLHRDIKPSNVLVTKDHRDNYVAKVMDFGIGKAFQEANEDPAMTALTRAGAPGPGTPAYMAPEQIDPVRFGQVGPWTDLYALGIMLYETLTFSVPFDGTYTELLHKQTNVDPPDPKERNPNITPELRAVLIKALKKNPADRYQSAADMQTDLQALGGGTMVAAPGAGGRATGGFAPQVGTPKPRSSGALVPVLMGVFAVLLIGGAVAYYLLAGGRSSSPGEPEASEPAVAAPQPAPGVVGLPPEITLAGPSPTRESNVVFNVLYTDPSATLTADQVQLQGSLAENATVAEVSGEQNARTITVNIPAEAQEGTVSVAILDDEGATAATSAPYIIDRVAPTPVISRVGEERTDGTSVVFGVSFGESVGSSFDSSDVELTGDLAANATFSIKSNDPSYEIVATPQNAEAAGSLGMRIKPGGVEDLAGNTAEGAESDFMYAFVRMPSDVVMARNDADAARSEATERITSANGNTEDSENYQEALMLVDEAQTLLASHQYTEAKAKFAAATDLFNKASAPKMAATPPPTNPPAQTQQQPTAQQATVSAPPASLKSALTSAESASLAASQRLQDGSRDPSKNSDYQQASQFLQAGRTAEKNGNYSDAQKNYQQAEELFKKIQVKKVAL